MADGTDDVFVVASVTERRTLISTRVREWCAAGTVESNRPELSDDVALLIAGGYADESTRSILANRRSVGRSFPEIGGFSELRYLTDELARTRRRLLATRIGPVQVVLERRVQALAKRVQSQRSAIVHSNRPFAKTEQRR